ncbi:hypothetical protein G7054_g3910 [Neopestalotiopsis clavispora]|nr:hypothetical protein G7054_g3910 [Neopestalotiopsis clavispora]
MAGAKKRYAIIGTGGRAIFFYTAIAKDYSSTSCIVGIADTNQTRMNFANDKLESLGHPKVPTYLAADFDKFIAETRPDEVIVTTIDRTHNIYIVRALELGCNVVTEKPMTIDVPRCLQIFDAVERTGNKVRVTFNYRYAPHNTKVFELLRSGAIGTVTSVHFEWALNTSHGADYFRRWHRDRRNSGGLLVHKSTHHFDLVNFWLQTQPQTRRGQDGPLCPAPGPAPPAQGHVPRRRARGRLLPGPERVRRRHQHRGHDEPAGALQERRRHDLLAHGLRALGRVPRRLQRHRRPLELEVVENSYVNSGGDQAAEGSIEKTTLLLRPLLQKPREVEIPQGTGAHGGGDTVLLNDLFGEPVSDEYMRAASHVDGALSILTGIAANKSIATGQVVNVDDVLRIPLKK